MRKEYDFSNSKKNPYANKLLSLKFVDLKLP